MSQSIRKAARGQLGTYLKFLVALMATSTIILAAMAVSGCDACDTKVKRSPYVRRAMAPPESLYRARIEDPNYQPTRSPGERVSRNLSVFDVAHQPEAFIEYTWTPPPGATNFHFLLPPENPNGPPPFVWKDIDESSQLEVAYDLPQLPSGKDSMIATEVLQAEVSGTGETTTVGFETSIQRPPGSSGMATGSSGSLAAGAASGGGVTAQLSGGVWDVGPYVYTKGVTLTAQMCQDWLDFLQSDSAFAAVRMPMAPTAPGLSYPVPIVTGGTYSASLQLMRQANTPIMTAALEIRAERFNFAENNLPSAAGEHWATLGVAITPTLTCPAQEFPLPFYSDWSKYWEVHPSVILDLDDQFRTLPVYVCYDGQEEPLASAGQQAALALAGALGAGVGAAYQGEGITCVGPELVALQDTSVSALELRGSAHAAVTPTQTISCFHTVTASPPQTVTLDYGSSLGTWALYEATDEQSPPGSSITPGTTELGTGIGGTSFWAITTIPAVSDPVHFLILTATSVTSPDLFVSAADLLWVGEWQPPPGGGLDVYLPLIRR